MRGRQDSRWEPGRQAFARGHDELELRIESVSGVVAYQRTPTLRNSPFRSGRYVSSVS
jgi:hypothetical protein